MLANVPAIVTALEVAIDEQRTNLDDDCPYEHGYLEGLERAANIVVAKAYGLKAGIEP